jgi:hypothetical protein
MKRDMANINLLYLFDLVPFINPLTQIFNFLARKSTLTGSSRLRPSFYLQDRFFLMFFNLAAQQT